MPLIRAAGIHRDRAECRPNGADHAEVGPVLAEASTCQSKTILGNVSDRVFTDHEPASSGDSSACTDRDMALGESGLVLRGLPLPTSVLFKEVAGDLGEEARRGEELGSAVALAAKRGGAKEEVVTGAGCRDIE